MFVSAAQSYAHEKAGNRPGMEMTMQQNIVFLLAKHFLYSLTVVVILTLGAPLSFPAVAADDPLRVGMELSYPPFEMTDTNGRPSGVSVSLAKAIGQHLEAHGILKPTDDIG